MTSTCAQVVYTGFQSLLLLTGYGGLNHGTLMGGLSSVAVKGSIDA